MYYKIIQKIQPKSISTIKVKKMLKFNLTNFIEMAYHVTPEFGTLKI